LALLLEALEKPLYAVNLCLSYLGREVDGVAVNVALFDAAVEGLLEISGLLSSPGGRGRQSPGEIKAPNRNQRLARRHPA
jgi:hypothetical protein